MLRTLLALCVATLSASPALAQKSPPGKGRGPALLARVDQGPALTALGVERLDVAVEIRGLVAETAATLTFRNPQARPLEAELVFPLPDGATLSGFALDVGGEMVDGVIVEAQAARVAFEQEVRKGVDPGLAEWVRGSAFRTRVWPVPAEGTRTVRVRYL